MSGYYDQDDSRFDEAREDARAERANRSIYRCDGYCGATDCETCYPGNEPEEDADDEEAVLSTKTVTARKARFEGTVSEIRPGDRVMVTSGFTYEVGGPRTGYFHQYKRMTKGPGWTN